MSDKLIFACESFLCPRYRNLCIAVLESADVSRPVGSSGCKAGGWGRLRVVATATAAKRVMNKV